MFKKISLAVAAVDAFAAALIRLAGGLVLMALFAGWSLFVVYMFVRFVKWCWNG